MCTTKRWHLDAHRQKRRSPFNPTTHLVWVVGFTYFIPYKYIHARCMHTLPIGFTFEFLERYNVSLTGLI
jgi:hypothetical protein